MDEAICFATATELVGRIRRREISSREVLEAHLRQIERVNPAVNAIVTLVAERALQAASEADQRSVRGEALGPLHGLPVAHKDLVPTAGIRTTQGSPIFADDVPAEDGLIVTRLRAAGAITIGKTNTPEFGAGSQTFNPVFGVTRNPYRLDRTCGGSSGGAAVALATGMLPIADGSDTGGSLRNPAAFCNVVGMRPSAGRVPGRARLSWEPLGVTGMMARTVEDVALAFGAVADALPGGTKHARIGFHDPLERDVTGLRVGFSADLGGLPLDPVVRAVVDSHRATFTALGMHVVEDVPAWGAAQDVFRVLRAWSMEASLGEVVRAHRSLVKETVQWNVAEGERLSGPEVGRAAREQAGLAGRMRDFFERCDVFVCATTQVPPFDVELEYPTSVDGRPMETYIDWMQSCSLISATGCPAISLPAGFTPDGLPVGLQIVAPHRSERFLLEVAWAFQEATRVAWRHPEIALSR